ncbi:hypothetical protein C0581_04560 [Candidatus Parcubacteria bacterium]|nr:MAG: hypothetical protein C0581_04560 [Candidatus Parcubacteria bacterium]
MTTTRKIAHNTIAQMIGKVISTLLGLVAVAMLTRYLGAEQFGWYITTITFLLFVGILTDFGMTPVTASMIGEKKYDETKLFKNLFAFRLVTSVFFLGIAPLIALLFPYPVEVKIAIGFSTISFLGIALNQVLVGFYQTKLTMYIQAIGEVVGRIVLVGGLWLFIQKGSSFLPLMGVVAAASVSYTLVMLIWAWKKYEIGFAFDKAIWKAIITKMWPIAISIIFNVVYLKGDTLLLTLFREQTEVGIYGAAYRVIDIMAQTAMMLMGVMLPLLAYSWSKKLKQEFRHRYQLSFDSMMLLAVPMTIGTIVLANKLMGFVAGAEFISSGRPLQILALAVFGVFVGGVFGHVAVAIDKQKQTMWIYISNAFVTLVGYLIFIPLYGMYGAAWMTVFSEMYAGILLFFVIRYYVKENLSFKTFGKIITSGIFMGAALYLLQDLHVLLLILIGIVVYGLAILGTGAISKKTVKEVLTLKP